MGRAWSLGSQVRGQALKGGNGLALAEDLKQRREGHCFSLAAAVPSNHLMWGPGREGQEKQAERKDYGLTSDLPLRV